jgi:hypothetical protein
MNAQATRDRAEQAQRHGPRILDRVDMLTFSENFPVNPIDVFTSYVFATDENASVAWNWSSSAGTRAVRGKMEIWP